MIDTVAPGRVLREDQGALCTLTLSRPDKLNALDNAMFAELEAHIEALEAADSVVGCVVLRGAGRGFCAGADIRVLGQVDDRRWKPRIVERLAQLPQPLVVAVHGACYTGGLELALAGDFIVAEVGARFADTHGKWGLVGEWGMFQRLPRRIGLAAAKRMMMTACMLEAEEAHARGLVDELAPAGALGAAVGELTAAILANSAHTNFATKRMLRETDGMSLAEALAYGHYHGPGFAPDWKERVARFAKAT